MPLPLERIYTAEDYWNLPDGQRAELIDGQLFDMAPPNRLHQKLTGELYYIILNHIKNKRGSCEVYPAPFAVNLNADDKTYVEPDISVICDKNKLTDRGCNGAPDFIIEVVSPASRKRDYATKNVLYSEAGVREYWIVDPARARTTIYRYEDDEAPMVIPFEQSITVGIYGDLAVNIAEILTVQA